LPIFSRLQQRPLPQFRRQSCLKGKFSGLGDCIDLYSEYAVTDFLNFHKHKFANQPTDEIYKEVKDEDENLGIVWLNPSAANDTYALAVRRAGGRWEELLSWKTLLSFALFICSFFIPRILKTIQGAKDPSTA